VGRQTSSLSRLQRLERSAAIERLERLERTDPRDERSKALERLERLERTDPRDERSAAIENKSAHGEPVEPLERLEQAQAKIVLSFMKDRRATISSVDHMINKTSLLPARDSSASAASITPRHAIATGEK
jgi:hypothetical protein